MFEVEVVLEAGGGDGDGSCLEVKEVPGKGGLLGGSSIIGEDMCRNDARRRGGVSACFADLVVRIGKGSNQD